VATKGEVEMRRDSKARILGFIYVLDKVRGGLWRVSCRAVSGSVRAVMPGYMYVEVRRFVFLVFLRV
jgi:hypothetical protein